MDKIRKQFARIAKVSKDEYIISDRLWQNHWKKTVESMLDELVEGYNEIDKLMKLVHEKIDNHIRKHNEVNYNKMMKGG